MACLRGRAPQGAPRTTQAEDPGPHPGASRTRSLSLPPIRCAPCVHARRCARGRSRFSPCSTLWRSGSV
eukprot:gene8527-biopygen18131